MILHKSKSRAIREFENWAGSYDRSILNLTLFGPARRMMLTELRKQAARSKGTFRLLDIGCGTGKFLAKCLAKGWDMELVGLDMAYNMIYQARRNTNALNNGLG